MTTAYYNDLLSLVKSSKTKELEKDKGFFNGLKTYIAKEFNIDNEKVNTSIDLYCDVNNAIGMDKNRIGVSAPIFYHSDKIPDTRWKYVIYVYILNSKLAKIADINPYTDSFGAIKTIGPFETKDDAEKYILDNNILDKKCNGNIRIAYNGHFNSLTAKANSLKGSNVKHITEDKNGRKIIIDTETEYMHQDTLDEEEMERRKYDLQEFNKACEDTDSISHYIMVKQKSEQLEKSISEANKFVNETNLKLAEAMEELNVLNKNHPTFINIWQHEKEKSRDPFLSVDLDKKSTLKTLPSDSQINNVGSNPNNIPSLFKKV